jgi:hypothetical protein
MNLVILRINFFRKITSYLRVDKIIPRVQPFKNKSNSSSETTIFLLENTDDSSPIIKEAKTM